MLGRLLAELKVECTLPIRLFVIVREQFTFQKYQYSMREKNI